jgi:hypothetical protein
MHSKFLDFKQEGKGQEMSNAGLSSIKAQRGHIVLEVTTEGVHYKSMRESQ